MVWIQNTILKVVLGPSVSLQVQYKIKGPGDKFVPIRGGFVCLVFVLDHVKWDPATKNTPCTIQVKLTSLEVKVAEHSFQEPIPISPLLLSYLSFGARFLQESRLTIEEFILAFWLRCELLPWQRG